MIKRYRLDVEVDFWIGENNYRVWAPGEEFDTEAEAEAALRKYLTDAPPVVRDVFTITTIYRKA